MKIAKDWTKIIGNISCFVSSEIDTLNFEKPFIIKSAVIDSMAVKNWTADYLNARLGDQIIDVFISVTGEFPGGEGPYNENCFCYKKMSLSEFLKRTTSHDSGYDPIIKKGEKYYIYQSPENIYSKIIHELPDHPVITKYNKKLKGDFRKNVWISSFGNITPPHTDVWLDNFLVQIHGKKKILLWDPKYTASLYIHPFGQKHSRQSPINPCVKNEKDFPKYLSAMALEGIIDAGDILFIPEGWIHYIQTIEFSISINYWSSIEHNISADMLKLITKIKHFKSELQDQYLHLLRWPKEFLNLDEEL